MNKICFDIGGSLIKLNIFDDNKQPILTDSIEHREFLITEIYGHKMKTVRLIECLNSIKNYIENYNQEVEVGIAIPGVIDTVNKKVLTMSSIVEIDVDINDFFNKVKLVKKLFIENDAKAAAIGELIYGQKNELTNGVILTIGTGLGGGIIINKKLYKGSHYAAGEFSQLLANINTPEIKPQELSVATTSTSAICQTYTMLTQQEHKIDGKQFMELVTQGEEQAVILFEKWIKTLRNLLINFQIIFDLEKILIGGGISNNKYFIESLKNEINKIKMWQVNVEQCKLTNNAACYGMLALLTNEYEE